MTQVCNSFVDCQQDAADEGPFCSKLVVVWLVDSFICEISLPDVMSELEFPDVRYGLMYHMSFL